jgi:hypothetical protein
MARTELRSAQIKDTDIATIDIADRAVTNAKLATMAANTIKGVSTAGVVQDLIAAEALSVIGAASASHTHSGIYELAGAVATHADSQNVHGLAISSAKILTVQNSLTLKGTDGGVITFPSGTITLLAAGGALGTPSSGTLTNATGLPISTGVSGLGSGVSTFLTTPTSANLNTIIADSTGSGSLVFGTSPILTTPNLGTPSALVGTNISGTAASLTAGAATKLATARTIAGVSFDGSANIGISSTNLTDTVSIAYLNTPNSFIPSAATGIILDVRPTITGTGTFYGITSLPQFNAAQTGSMYGFFGRFDQAAGATTAGTAYTYYAAVPTGAFYPLTYYSYFSPANAGRARFSDGVVIGGDPGAGIATTITLTNATYPISTGVGSIKTGTPSNYTNSGWLQIYVGVNPRYIPYWTSI